MQAAVFLAALVLASLALAGLAFAWRALGGQRRAEARAAVAERQLALLAPELRATGLALLARAEAAGPAPAALARAVLRLADSAADAAADHKRRLAEVPTMLGPLLREATDVATALLAPATRRWRIAEELAALSLSADPRALHGALLPVLLRAARATRDGEAIELRLVRGPGTLAIVVEDEGAGLATGDLDPARRAGAATRGLDAGLATARALLAAHGGDLVAEAASGIGSRTWLILPAARAMG